MDIKLKVDISDNRMSDGLLAAMNAINQINAIHCSRMMPSGEMSV